MQRVKNRNDGYSNVKSFNLCRMKTKILIAGILTCVVICLAFPIKANFFALSISGVVYENTTDQPFENVLVTELGYEESHLAKTDKTGFFNMQVSHLPTTLKLERRTEEGAVEKKQYEAEQSECLIDWSTLQAAGNR